MKEEKVSDALLRQFLLGTTDEEEREHIEGLFLTDSDLRDRVLAIEQEYISMKTPRGVKEEIREAIDRAVKK